MSLGATFWHGESHRRVWQLAWPMILSNITVPLLGMVDTAVIGHLPEPHYLGAVAIGASLFSLLYWSFGFLRMGTTGLTARALGRQDPLAQRRLLGQSLVLAALLGLGLILLQQPLLSLGLALMDPSPAVLEQARLYCALRIYSAPAVLANYALLGWFLGLQNSRVPLLLLVSANLVNMILDLLLVMGLGWGVTGVAVASLCADYASLGLGGWLALRHLQRLPGPKLPLAALWRWRDYGPLLRSNRYLMVRTLCLLFCFAFFTAQGARLGDSVLAANAVLLNFLLLISHGLDGFAHAVEALCGRYLGARDQQGFIRACAAATLWSLGTALGFAALFYLGGELLIRLLTDIPAVVSTARSYLPWLVALPLLGVWSYLLDGIFIGANWFRAMQNCMLVATLGIYLPAWYLGQGLGNHGLWLALALLLAGRGVLGGAVFAAFVRRRPAGDSRCDEPR
ncbi:MATE family efflux transporter [Motiliproteus sp. SC1-56]|uniref:MATE family efflux transporter n=1 Tax=Motiliproteus sp. SC1-56 TaxID=2799565 RepID=UPI001A8C972D|nr:MATE family efflux transporter [Motiliproteus sp. SC1-56]